MAEQVGDKGLVVLSDINAAMLEVGRDRLLDRGLLRNVRFSLANAECLPFADETFDCVTIGFGLRNVTDKPAALASMRRVLKPGGRLLVLEFSKPVLPGPEARLRRLLVQRAAVARRARRRATRTATATSPNRSAASPTRRRCSA